MNRNPNEVINWNSPDSSAEYIQIDRSPADMILPSAMFPPFGVFLAQHQQQLMHNYQQNWSQGHPLQYSSNNASSALAISSSTASSGYTVLTDSRQIQMMDNTVKHLQKLLANEIKNVTTEKLKSDDLTKQLETLQRQNRNLKQQVEDALNEKELAQQEVKAAEEKLVANQIKIQSLCKDNCELKCAKILLEAKVEESSKEPEMCNNQTSVTKSDDQSTINEDQLEYRKLKAQFDELQDKFRANTKVKNRISKQFQELARKNVFLIFYSGEQLYSDLKLKHTEFIKTLKDLSAKSSTNKIQRALINQSVGSIQGQLKLLEDMRADFKVTTELLMVRVDSGLALVSDLNIRAPRPQLDIPVDQFNPLLQVISRAGCDGTDSNSDTGSTTSEKSNIRNHSLSDSLQTVPSYPMGLLGPGPGAYWAYWAQR